MKLALTKLNYLLFFIPQFMSFISHFPRSITQSIVAL